MADQVPPLGHLPRIFERMFAENDSIPKSCVEVVNVLSGSGVSEGGREGGRKGGREGGRGMVLMSK